MLPGEARRSRGPRAAVWNVAAAGRQQPADVAAVGRQELVHVEDVVCAERRAAKRAGFARDGVVALGEQPDARRRNC
jgi:hypothetical protein